MSINISNLHNVLVQKMQNITDKTEILQYTKAIEQLNLGIVTLVSSFASLPAVPDVVGSLYFSQSDRALYIYNIEYAQWILLSQDTITTAWAWGSNNCGQLGDNTLVSKCSPVNVVGGFTDWCRVSASSTNCMSAAIRTNGTLWAWGINFTGALGDNTIVNKSSPVSVVGGFTDWCQVAVAGAHMSAVRTNGSLWSWGQGSRGQLGNNTIVNKSSPVSVVGGFTDWCQVAAGRYHTAAVRTNGTIWAWGYNNRGQLGDNTCLTKSSPVSVVGGFADWCQVSAGWNHTAAIRTNGTLWTWGYNGVLQLGDNTTLNKNSPVSVVGGFTDWCQISAGRYHNAALRTNGSLWSWGYGSASGNNTTETYRSPVSVVGGFTDWCQVAAGGSHTAAIRTNGTLWSWGVNNGGQLGDNTTVNKSSPVSVVDGFTDWCQVSAGRCHTVALRTKILS